MTNKEIIKALECCKKPVGTGACKDCPLDKDRPCTTTMIENALDLINRQQAEIERLQERDETAEKIIREQGGTILHLKDENSRLFDRNCELSEKGEKAVIACVATRNKAIKEFAERLAIDLAANYTDEYCHWIDDTIYNLVKEMVGDTE